MRRYSRPRPLKAGWSGGLSKVSRSSQRSVGLIGSLVAFFAGRKRTLEDARVAADAEDGLGLGTDDVQRRGGAGLVCDLDEEGGPALLDQFILCRAGGDFDAHLGIDGDGDEAVGIEDRLDFGGGGVGVGEFGGGIEGGFFVGVQWGSGEVQGFGEAVDLGGEGLDFDAGDCWEVGCVECGRGGETKRQVVAAFVGSGSNLPFGCGGSSGGESLSIAKTNSEEGRNRIWRRSHILPLGHSEDGKNRTDLARSVARTVCG